MHSPPAAQVINLNNRAVTLLRHGQQKRALDTFRLALEIFQEAQSRMDEGEGQEQPEEEQRMMSAQHDPFCTSSHHHAAQVDVDGAPLAVQGVVIRMHLDASDDAQDAHLHVFNRALVMTHHHKHQDTIITSVLYNLALVSHLRGVQTRSQARYAAALRLYQMAYEIIQSHDDQSIFEDILILALVNNLGHVQRRLGQSEEARRQTDYLRIAIGMSSQQSPKEEGEGAEDEEDMTYAPEVDEQDYFFFYLNALEERVSAPAA